MQIRSSASRGRRRILIALVAVMGLTVGFIAESATASPLAKGHVTLVKAHVAKKKCKKGKKSAAAAKKKCKKKKVAPPVVAPPPTPQPLTEQAVVTRVDSVALGYCNADPDCVDWGHFTEIDTGLLSCQYKSTYSWSCYGGNEEYWPGLDPSTDYWLCAFLEIVERDGISGIKSHTDSGYGWDCFPET